MKFFRISLILMLILANFYWLSFDVQAGPPRNPTFTFSKDGSNPIVPVGEPGSWDESAIVDPNVLKEADGVYKMYYLAWDHLYNSGIGLATSPDGITWTKYAGNPVMTGTPGSYDANLWEAEVRKYGDTYQMWYQASGDGGWTYQSHYATSPDGITWTKYAGNPILTGGVGKWDQDYAGIRSVIKIGNTYHAWYEASKYINRPLSIWNKFNIGYATSTDGINWTKYSVNSPVLSGDAGQWDNESLVPSVNRVGNLFVMFYSTHDTTANMGIATSIDGINWTKYPNNPLYDLFGAPGEWDSLASTTIISSIVDSYNPAVYRIYYRGQGPAVMQVGGMTMTTVLPSYPYSLNQYKSDGVTSIAAGGASNDTTMVFKFDMSSGVLNDLLTPQIELREFGVPFTGEPTHSGTPVPYNIFDVTGEVTVSGLENGKSYHWQAIANNAGGNNISSFVDENLNEAADFSVDTVAPNIPIITSVAGNNVIENSEATSVHVIGTAEAGSTVGVTLTDRSFPVSHTISNTAVATNGNYDIIINSSTLGVGDIDVVVTATDVANNVSDPATMLVQKNLDTPEVETIGFNRVSSIEAVGRVLYENSNSVTDYGFQYGLTNNYGLTISAGSGSISFSKVLTSLDCDSTYHFRSYATNSFGTGYGLDKTFYVYTCPSSSTIFNKKIPKLLSTWFSFSEDQKDKRNIFLNF